MTTLNYRRQRPPYPVFSERGIQPIPHVPPDLWPSGLGPGYTWYQSAHGRYLAGLGADMKETNFDGVNSEGIETYPNELDTLAQADDIVGNGVFDPNDTHGNIHPDAGLFQDHQSLPGYVARDHFYELSEVRDLTRPDGRVVYVPGGAVALQQGQQQTLTDVAEFWKLPPGINPITPEDVDAQSTVDAPTATWPVHRGVGETYYGAMQRVRDAQNRVNAEQAARGSVSQEAIAEEMAAQAALEESLEAGTFESEPVKTNYTPYYIAAGVGLAAGLLYLAMKGKKR